MTKDDIALHQARAKEVEEFLTTQRLYYGTAPRQNGNASWAIALHNHSVSDKQAQTMNRDLPIAIMAFHKTCSRLMKSALGDTEDPTLLKLREYIVAGVPDIVIKMWAALSKQPQAVFSSRPDLVIDNHGLFHIIEYNTDGGADKGNTLGVNEYSQKIFDQPVLGKGLARAFVDEIGRLHAGSGEILVVTAVPDEYRTEYEAQNRYFSEAASEYGRGLGVTWVTRRLSEIDIEGSGVMVHIDGKHKRVDVIDREFKLPGFTREYNFKKEIELLNAITNRSVTMLGSTLPFQDKVLLSVLFDDTFSTYFEPDMLRTLRSLHAETAVLDKKRGSVKLDKVYSLEQVRNRDLDIDIVLKRGGDNIGSTGSKGLVISTDVNDATWQEMFDRALEEPFNGGSYWIIQKFYQSDKFSVEFIKSSRALPKKLDVINRTAPYYVQQGNGYVLGNVLVTAGTDMETYNKQLGNIHGLRCNAYQAVVADQA